MCDIPDLGQAVSVEHDGVVEEGGLAARLQDAPLPRVDSGQVGKELRVRLQPIVVLVTRSRY